MHRETCCNARYMSLLTHLQVSDCIHVSQGRACGFVARIARETARNACKRPDGVDRRSLKPRLLSN
jgi:hypothetical protein